MDLMANKAELKEAAAEHHMERRIIRVECLPDQAGIAAALRRAFAAGPIEEGDSDRLFDDLLQRLH
jgi:AcrR family transcriptional regulator